MRTVCARIGFHFEHRLSVTFSGGFEDFIIEIFKSYFFNVEKDKSSTGIFIAVLMLNYTIF
jgi:hypothetical protein